MTEYEHDPLADATYIRANFSYIPRTVKELSIKASDIFHIHDEVHYRGCGLVTDWSYALVFFLVSILFGDFLRQIAAIFTLQMFLWVL